MRGLLSRLGLRLGVAAGLALLVLGAVAVARTAGGGETSRDFPGAQTTSTVDPTAGDDGPDEPTPSAYPDDADVRAAAEEFAAAWLRRDLAATAWHAGVAGLATDSLAQSLTGVDPSTVPAARAAGAPVISLRADLFALVTVPVDTGTVRLNLLHDGERWLVDGIDWERA